MPDPMRRTIHLLLALIAPSLIAAASLAPAAAYAGEKEVPRINTFGGSCPKCELSGRRLRGAHFLGADFSGASFVRRETRVPL